MLDHPFIVADLQNPHQPKSAPGVVVEALSRRKQAGLPYGQPARFAPGLWAGQRL
jgi:mannitol-1-phosphate/altronate dehydrogenase